MATFLILPPREILEHAVCGFAAKLFPGMPQPVGLWQRFMDEMIQGMEDDCDGPVFVLHREDLSSQSLAESLTEGFGAIPGDFVVEIDAPRQSGPGAVRHWTVPGVRRSAKIG